jgi:hypothetical protein
MTTTPVTSRVSQPLDVHGDFTPTITFNGILIFEYLSNPVYIVTIEIVTIHGERKIYFFEYLSSRGQPNTMYVS